MNTVLIIGGGNIGFRHFQGLLLTDLSLVIFVIDPNDEALNRMGEYFENNDYPGKKCFFLNNIEYIPNEIDLCIIATSSKVRLEVAEKLFNKSSIQYLILEKVLFQKESDYERMSSLLKENKVGGCWVNCPLRTIEIFKELKEKINKNELTCNVNYKELGIGCNSIHLIDLFSFLTNCQNINIDTSKLERVIKSKRVGYLEILGMLTVVTKKGDKLIITSNNQASHTYFMRYKFNKEVWTIYPLLGKILIEDNNNNDVIEKTFMYPKLSSITSQMVTELFLTKNCSLPDYETSKHLHLIMIKGFNHFFSSALDYEVIECPIT
ncbi:Gfo/Idh/MocA family oxidoreductase [Cytobacillus firmus]|uniref:Gfo/Idh/MocA family oxidoreductase n=1 Tax=Bacillus sp. 22-7 TaxID=2709707 RepID=UPI0013D4ABC1|nr:Gfo/Idh/MocA family oxidoreductase [Bacillus sp. 22-7]